MTWLAAPQWLAELRLPRPVNYEVPPSILGEAVLKIAFAEIGKGEAGANNVGPDLDRYRRGGPDGAWCAAFVSWCLEQGCEAIGEPLCPIGRSHNAKRLFNNALAVGARVTRPIARDLVLWHRGATGAVTGHIGIVSKVDGNSFHSIEGNRGGGTDARGTFHPSLVREFLHELGEPLLLGFARLP